MSKLIVYILLRSTYYYTGYKSKLNDSVHLLLGSHSLEDIFQIAAMSIRIAHASVRIEQIFSDLGKII